MDIRALGIAVLIVFLFFVFILFAAVLAGEQTNPYNGAPPVRSTR